MRVRPNPHTIYLSYHFFPHQYLHCVVLSASPHTKYTQADMSFFYNNIIGSQCTHALCGNMNCIRCRSWAIFFGLSSYLQYGAKDLVPAGE